MFQTGTWLRFARSSVGAFLALSACGGEAVVASSGHGDHEYRYDEIQGSGGLSRQVGLCELLTGAQVVGVFRVDEIVGRPVLHADGREEPRIFISSVPEETWAGSSTVGSRLTFRVEGGDVPSGSYLVPPVSARVGERVVLVIHDPTLPITNEVFIFREVISDRFSNGQLFVSGGIELGDLRTIAQEVGRGACTVSDDFGFEPPSDESGRGDLDGGEVVIERDQ